MPTWMTLAPGPKRPIFPAASTEPKICQLVSGLTIHTYDQTTRNSTGTLGKSQFAACYEMLIVIGERTSTTGPSNRVMPAGHHRAGEPPAQTRRGCRGCKVNLCSNACFEAWNHVAGDRLKDGAAETVIVCATVVKPKKARHSAPAALGRGG